MGVSKYRKKPVVIDALQLTERNGEEVRAFIEDGGGKVSGWSGHTDGRTFNLSIFTLEGTMYADVGDWIIRGVQGEFYPCKPDIFEATYEPAPGCGRPSQYDVATPCGQWVDHFDGPFMALCAPCAGLLLDSTTDD